MLRMSSQRYQYTCKERHTGEQFGTLWHHDPMLPIHYLMNRKALTQSTSSDSEVTVPCASLPRKKKSSKSKRKLPKKRMSLSSTALKVSVPLVSDSCCKGPDELKKSPSNSSLPKVKVSWARIDELSMPSMRSSQLLQNLSICSIERRKKLPLLSAIKPDNEKSEKERFMRTGFSYNPLFVYRCPADEDLMERFTTPSNHYLRIAVHIMDQTLRQFGTYEEFEEQSGGKILTRPEIISLVRKYLRKEELESEIAVNLSEDLLSRGSIVYKNGRPQLNVRVANLRENWCQGLLRHELGTHYLRSANNRGQVWGSWQQRQDLCLQHFNPTEEGLASLHSVLLREHPFLWRAALLYYVAFKAAHMSFKDLFMEVGRFVHSPAVRWDYCMRAKRGQRHTSQPGTFCKDQVYLEGALQLLKRRCDLDFHLLMRLGKVAHGDIDKLVNHGQLEGTRVPSFMSNLSEYRKQLNHIAETNGLTDDILSQVE